MGAASVLVFLQLMLPASSSVLTYKGNKIFITCEAQIQYHYMPKEIYIRDVTIDLFNHVFCSSL